MDVAVNADRRVRARLALALGLAGALGCASSAPASPPPDASSAAHSPATPPASLAAVPHAGPIAAGPLDVALREFARQSGLQVVWVAELTRGRRARALRESLPASRALARLLAGSGLDAEFLNDRTVQVRARPRVRPVRALPAPHATPPAAPPPAEPALAVTVTARKREEDVLAVPLSITVVPGSTLARFGLADFQDMQLYAPGFVVTPTPANSFVFVRGIGTQGNVLAFESSVALFVDGVYGGRNRQLQNPPFLDVERVEVLRGPQGALFGRNTSAGAVSVTSARPTRAPEAWVQADYELEYGARAATAVASGPLADTLQARLALRLAEDPGFLDNVGLGRRDGRRRDRLARGSFAWQPAADVDVRARVDWGETRLIGSPFELVRAGGRPAYAKATDDGLAPERDDSRSLDAMLQADLRRGGHVLTAIAGRSAFEYANAINIQALAPARLVVENAEDFDQRSLELRWLSPAGGAVEWVAGAYADAATSLLPARSTTDFPFLPGYPDGVTVRRYVERTRSWAAFGQAAWRLAPGVDATAGLRYTAVDKRGDLARSFTGFAPGARTTPLAMRRDESFLDPSVDLQWEFAPRWRAFARLARGSKSGGSNGPTATDTERSYTYGPERSRSLEAGVKGAAAHGSLSAVVFDTRYRDLQKSVLDIGTGGFVTRNAAAARSRGLELEAAWAPRTDLRLGLSASWLDAEFTAFPGAKCPFGTPGFGVDGAACDIRGYPLTPAPRFGGALTVDYDRPLGAGLRLVGDLALLRRGSAYYQPSYHPLERQSGYTKVDLRAGIAAADDRWAATVLVRNATDVVTSSLVFETFPFFIDRERDRVHVPDRPRTVTLQLRYALR